MKYDLRVLFLLFIVYSFIGWIVEIVYSYYKTGKVVNRGFLIGPYCPIYGFGCILMIMLLTRYYNQIFVLFVMCIVIFSILEYMTSYIMEKIFKARWWDYSNRKYNINGRVCLETMIPFGFGGILIMYIVNPILMYILNSIPDFLLTIFSILIGILYFTDVFISVKVVSSLKLKKRKIKVDNTKEIKEKVKETLSKKDYIKNRILKVFPKIKDYE